MKIFTARSLVVGGWIVAALSAPVASLSLPVKAFASTEVAALRPEVAQTDTSAPTQDQPVALATPIAHAPLQGGVTKLDELLTATDGTELYKIAVKKLTSGAELSADDYRALGVGCAGYESIRPFNQDVAVVTVVYHGSPDELAGIRKGDKLIDHDNDAATEHPEVSRWKVICGKAGSQANLIVLRHHKEVSITVTRMNIEDIPDKKARKEWEQILAKLGDPQEGTFEGEGASPSAY